MLEKKLQTKEVLNLDVGFREAILAIITTDESKVMGGSVPVFLARDEEEKEKISLMLAKVTSGIIHDLRNGCYVIVRH